VEWSIRWPGVANVQFSLVAESGKVFVVPQANVEVRGRRCLGTTPVTPNDPIGFAGLTMQVAAIRDPRRSRSPARPRTAGPPRSATNVGRVGDVSDDATVDVSPEQLRDLARARRRPSPKGTPPAPAVGSRPPARNRRRAASGSQRARTPGAAHVRARSSQQRRGPSSHRSSPSWRGAAPPSEPSQRPVELFRLPPRTAAEHAASQPSMSLRAWTAAVCGAVALLLIVLLMIPELVSAGKVASHFEPIVRAAPDQYLEEAVSDAPAEAAQIDSAPPAGEATEHQAVEALMAGRFRTSLTLYKALAAQSPDNPVYPRIVRVLEREIEGACRKEETRSCVVWR
jgi:hypothetical protein